MRSAPSGANATPNGRLSDAAVAGRPSPIWRPASVPIGSGAAASLPDASTAAATAPEAIRVCVVTRAPAGPPLPAFPTSADQS